MRRALFAAVVAVTTLVFVAPFATAHAQAATYDPVLRGLVEQSLSHASEGPYLGRWEGDELIWPASTTPKWVYVRCFQDVGEFEYSLKRFGDDPSAPRYTIAYHVHGTGTVNMRAGTCKLAREFARGHITQDTAGAFKTLLHEAIHRQGVRNERMTEAYAIVATRAAAEIVYYNLYPSETTFTEVGARAMRLSWQQSQRYIVRSYLSSWAYVNTLYRQGRSWADAV